MSDQGVVTGIFEDTSTTGPVNALPLSSEDRAILDLESPTVAGHTCKVLVLGSPAPDIDALRAAVEAGLDAAPALTRRLGFADAGPAWVPDRGFDIERHVVERPQCARSPAALPGSVADSSPSAWTGPFRCGASTCCASKTAAPRSSGASITRWRTARPPCASCERCCAARLEPHRASTHARPSAPRTPPSDARRRAHWERSSGASSRARGAVRRSTGGSVPAAGWRSPRRRSVPCTTPPGGSPAPPSTTPCWPPWRAACATGSKSITAAWATCGSRCP